MAMRIRPYSAERIAQYGRSKATLDATGCHHWANNGHRFWRKKSSCGVVKSLFKASIKKGTKRTLYSAHQSNELCRKVEHHN